MNAAYSMLLLESPLFLAVSRRHASTGSNAWLWLGLGVLAVAVGGAIYALVLYRNSLKVENARCLFRELCRAHQLTSSKRQLILKLANRLEIADPCVLFMDSTLWKMPDPQGANALTGKQWDRLRACQRELFLSRT